MGEEARVRGTTGCRPRTPPAHPTGGIAAHDARASDPDAGVVSGECGRNQESGEVAAVTASALVVARTRTRTLLKAGVFDAPSSVRGTRMFASG